MTFLARRLSRRLATAWLIASCAAGLMAWIGITAETGSLATSSAVNTVVLIAVITAVMAPLCLFCAITWVSLSLSANRELELLGLSGTKPRRVIAALSAAILVLLIVCAVGTELLLPRARDVIGASLLRQHSGNNPVVMRHEGSTVAFELGDRLDHLRRAWRWNGDASVQHQELRYDNGRWLNQRAQAVAGYPSPTAIVADQPFLIELMTVSELSDLLPPGSRARVLLGERIARPLFWWLWLTLLAALLLRQPLPYPLMTAAGLGMMLAGTAVWLAGRKLAILIAF